jgi:hypothetical protein
MWRYVPCETSGQGAETQLQSFKGGPRQLTFGFVQSVRHSSAHAHVVTFWPAIGESGLAMSGAKPLYVSGAFILEEGLSMEDLRMVVESKRAAAAESEVTLVIGDTKVVNRGKGDKIFITTTGIGWGQ